MKRIQKIAVLSLGFIFMVKGASASMENLQYPRILHSALQRYQTQQFSFYKQSFSSQDSVFQIARFYQARLFRLGWQEVTTEKYGGSFVYMFQKPGNRINLLLWRDKKNLVTYGELTHTLLFSRREVGYDLMDVPCYPTAKRILFMEQEDGQTLILAYTTMSSLPAVHYFYKTYMENLGWKSNPFLDQVAQRPSQSLLMFEAEGKECLVTIRQEENKSQTTIFILYRINNLLNPKH